jgi:hypothetical protein
MASDESIKFVGLTDKFGSLVSMAYRENPFSDEKEVEQYAIQMVLSTLVTEQFESKAGRTKHIITFHEGITRVTIPIVMRDHKFFVLLMIAPG